MNNAADSSNLATASAPCACALCYRNVHATRATNISLIRYVHYMDTNKYMIQRIQNLILLKLYIVIRGYTSLSYIR